MSNRDMADEVPAGVARFLCRIGLHRWKVLRSEWRGRAPWDWRDPITGQARRDTGALWLREVERVCQRCRLHQERN